MNDRSNPLHRLHAAFVAARRRQVEAYFMQKGFPTSPERPYSLRTHSDWPFNIIVETVAHYISRLKKQRHEEGRSFALHNYVHHGLSSQAFSWNLLGPLIVDEQWHIIEELLTMAGVPFNGKITGAELELEDPTVFNEDRGQPTSVDMCFRSAPGDNIFVEFKYTEADFGGCSVFRDGDCDGLNPANDFALCYLHNIGRKYWTLAESYGLLSEKMRIDSLCSFATLYQAYRLVLFTLVKGGHFLLLYDERNPAFIMERNGIKRGLWVRVYESLPDSARDRCHALSVQSVLKVLESHKELDWLAELKVKYF